MLTEAGRQHFIASGGHMPDGCPLFTQEGIRLVAELIVEIFKKNQEAVRIKGITIGSNK